jgi:hypothetical protein
MYKPSAMAWVVAQQQRFATERAAREAQSKPQFNPRPPGQLVDGSASDVVLKFLQKHRGVSFRYAELLKHTGCTPSALIWACSYLARQGMIEAMPDAMSGRRRFRYVFTRNTRTDARHAATIHKEPSWHDN